MINSWNLLNNALTENNDDLCEKNDRKCVECNSTNLFHDRVNANMVCTECGDVQTCILDENPEWSHDVNGDSNKKNQSRCGFPINPLLEKSSLSTAIKGNNNILMNKLHHQISMDHVERSRFHVFEHITRMAGDSGNLSQNVIDKAKYYYKILSERKLSRGSIRQGLIACCILYACNSENVSRSVKEIGTICEVESTVINKTRKIFIKTMDDILRKENMLHSSLSIHDMIPRCVNILQINQNIKHRLLILVQKLNGLLNDSNICEGKTPSAIICGMIIYICKLNDINIDKNSFVNHINISVVTVNKVIKLINDSKINNLLFLIQ